MPVTALVSVEEYLGTPYHPDCDYLEGRLLERAVGEVSHSDAQTTCAAFFRSNYKQYWAGVEVRVQVRPTRFRVPDVTVVRGPKPSKRIITEPPALAVEILSPEDRAGDMQERIDDYLAFGVPCVWVIDPERRRGFIHTPSGMHPTANGIMETPCGEIVMPLAELFGDDAGE